jgi:hypothetical protein
MALANTVTVNLHNPTFREVDDLGVNGAAVQFASELIGGVTMLGDPQSIADELHKAAAYMDELLELTRCVTGRRCPTAPRSSDELQGR